ncbi:hypothetical protein, partial [Rhizobium leguminosarum]|uniref:hypothetical protein n=1 Tax=Rhizobium leguminosarum TaxID=384 RepID=UPI001AEC3FBC
HFAGIDTGGFRDNLSHPCRPCLAYEPGCSSNHSGHDEEPIAILLLPNPKGSGGCDPTIGAFGRAAARPKASRLYNISYARWPEGSDEGAARHALYVALRLRSAHSQLCRSPHHLPSPGDPSAEPTRTTNSIPNQRLRSAGGIIFQAASHYT